jgi:hypothetical protein
MLDMGSGCKRNQMFWLIHSVCLKLEIGSPLTWDKLSFAVRSSGTVTAEVSGTPLMHLVGVVVSVCVVRLFFLVLFPSSLI